MPAPLKLFFSYAHKDEDLRIRLENHLSSLEDLGLIEVWHDRKIGAGSDWQGAIDENLKTADIILLLISASFNGSKDCKQELKFALEKHNNKTAVAIPVLLKPFTMEGLPYSALQCLPQNFIPVTKWPDQDEAFADIVLGIRKTVQEIHKRNASTSTTTNQPAETQDTQDTQTPPPVSKPPLPAVLANTPFKQFLHQQIHAELQQAEARWLNGQLAGLFALKLSADDLPGLITENLLAQPADVAIGNYLTLAAVDCISPGGCRYYEVRDNVQKVREIAEHLLAWLVLANCDGDKVAQLLPRSDKHQSYYFNVGVDLGASVEAILARRFGRKVDWRLNDKDSPYPKSPHEITLDDSLLNWSDKDSLRKILVQIWNQVFRAPAAQKPDMPGLDTGEIAFLNTVIGDRRQHPDKKKIEHHYIAFKLAEADSSFTENVYTQLLACLPEMTVVRYGIVGSPQQLFIIPEPTIIAKVCNFYHEINS